MCAKGLGEVIAAHFNNSKHFNLYHQAACCVKRSFKGKNWMFLSLFVNIYNQFNLFYEFSRIHCQHTLKAVKLVES